MFINSHFSWLSHNAFNPQIEVTECVKFVIRQPCSQGSLLLTLSERWERTLGTRLVIMQNYSKYIKYSTVSNLHQSMNHNAWSSPVYHILSLQLRALTAKQRFETALCFARNQKSSTSNLMHYLSFQQVWCLKTTLILHHKCTDRLKATICFLCEVSPMGTAKGT